MARGAVREHQRLEERVRGQTVGAVEPRARHLAAGVEALERGRAVQVREHAAAGVVGRGHDRDRLPRHVDPEAAAGLVHGREAAAHELRVTVRDVEVHALEAVHLHLVVDGARDDVARRELGARVVALHERLAVGPTEHRPLAAQRLGHEEGLRLGVVEAGRVELEELHVGDRRAGAVGHGDAVAGRDVGVGGVEVDLARAARAEEGRARGEAVHLARRAVEDVGAPADGALAAREQEVDGEVALVDGDVRRGAHGLAEGADHLAPGRVGGVQDAPLRVPALAPEVVLVVVGVAAQVEVRAQGDEIAHPVRALAHHHLDRVAVAEPVAGGERVGDVRLEAVLRAPHRGDAALRVAAVALGEPVLGDQRDVPGARALERAGEAGDAAAEHQEVALDGHGARASRARRVGSSA